MKTKCCVEDCENLAKSGGYCAMHLGRIARDGKPGGAYRRKNRGGEQVRSAKKNGNQINPASKSLFSGVCYITKCTNKVFRHGMCEEHVKEFCKD